MDVSVDLNVEMALEMVQSPLYQGGDGSQVAPIAFQALPEEILREIARLAVADGASVRILNRVCVSMRRAVNGMKSLWARFTIGYGYGVR
jgi:hypothetical protein